MSLIRPRHREEEEEEVEKVVQELGREGEYRVGLVVLNMPWVDMDFNVPPPNFPANSAKFPSALAELGRQWNDKNRVNSTQLQTTSPTLYFRSVP